MSPRSRHRRGAGLVMTWVFLASCVITFGLAQVWPDIQLNLLFAPWLGEIQPYRFLGSALLHADVWHLVLNMMALWAVGQWLEPLLGWWRFACLYVLSALGGNVAVALLADPANQSWVTYVVGASGAVFGLFGAYFVIAARFKGDLRAIITLLVLNLGLGFFVPGISWQSHVGGLITGAALTAVYTRRLKKIWHVVGTIAIALVLAGLGYLAYL